MLVAQQRARVRGIEDKVDGVQGSLLDLQQMDLGPFDYINCSGVLHHLEDPAARLAPLKSVLKKEGTIGLMLYGRYGRIGIDQLQKLMRLINHDLDGQELENAHAVIDRLPATNWCKRALDLFPIYEQLGDTEIYDLLLHKRDPTYTVTDVYELLDRCGLQLVEHTKDQRPLYESGFAFPEPPLRTQIEKLSRREQQAATELFWGAIT